MGRVWGLSVTQGGREGGPPYVIITSFYMRRKETDEKVHTRMLFEGGRLVLTCSGCLL